MAKNISSLPGMAAFGVAVVLAFVYPRPLPAQARAPKYEVDQTWPKPFPDRWVLGGLGGLCVDRRDHVLILNRQDVLDGDLNAGYLAPPVIEIDETGAVVHSWGNPDLLDPR